ncbi:MAG TPA: carboxypeptidase regulatory-like domain-containing protein [Bryobacteraceae bacterium]|nr:carboxypeptidase regulatory-like domain-containing protein [Bryobacteraceae bacterium]
MALRSVPSPFFCTSVFLAIALAQPLGTGAISGVVLDGESGDPVRKAIVTLTLEGTPRRWATTRTDGSGGFEFEGLPAGKYELRATKLGIGTANYGANHLRELGNLITLRKGESRGGLKLHFLHSATISGHVYDADGEPLADAAVSLVRQGRNLGAPVLTLYRGANTDDRGEYRLPDIDPGRYYLCVAPTRTMRSIGPDRTDEPIFADQYYDGAGDSKDATLLHVGESDLTGLDFHLVSQLPVDLHGQVLGVPEQPETGPGAFVREGIPMPDQVVQVAISRRGMPQSTFGAAATGPEHRFEIDGFAAGRYDIYAQYRGPDKRYAVLQEVDLEPGSADVVLTLSPAGDIQGTLRLEGTAPSNDGPGTPLLKDGGFRVGLEEPNTRRSYLTEVAAGGGHFTIKDVPPGEYQIQLTPTPPGYLKSAKYGDKDFRFTTVQVDPTKDAALNLVVSVNTATVEGKLDAASGDAARAGILIAAIGPYHNFTRFYYSGMTGADGKFRVGGIAPGKYKVFALENMSAQNFRNPEAADQLGELGEIVDLAEGAAVEVHPKLIPADRAVQALQ